MNWLYFSGTSIVFFTVLNLLQKVLATDGKNMRAMSLDTAVITGILLLKEHEMILKKALAGFLALAGVILLV